MGTLAVLPSRPPPFRTSPYESPHIPAITPPLFPISLNKSPHIPVITPPLFPISLYEHPRSPTFMPSKPLPSLPSLHFHLLRMPTATLGDVLYPQSQWMISFSILQLFDYLAL